MKSHIQNSTNHFFWDNVIARSHIALTIHLTCIRGIYRTLCAV